MAGVVNDFRLAFNGVMSKIKEFIELLSDALGNLYQNTKQTDYYKINLYRLSGVLGVNPSHGRPRVLVRTGTNHNLL